MRTTLIGIDPGVTTGIATWDRATRQLVDVCSVDILEAMERVHLLRLRAEVWFEDARLRTWFGTKGREALQGAGSIKRDCAIWEAFCLRHEIPYRALKPQRGATKWTDPAFRTLTGWPGRTNEHARDAAMLVYGVRPALNGA